MTRPDNGVVEQIVLRFKPFRAKYVKSKPWHPSQETLEDTLEDPETSREGYCDIGFRLIVNKELIARILEFGDDVVVVAPLGLREAVVEVLKKSLLGYGFL